MDRVHVQRGPQGLRITQEIREEVGRRHEKAETGGRGLKLQ